MIAFVRGKVFGCDEMSVILDNAGIGMKINVPMTVIESLPPVGEEFLLHTYMSVSENDISLYGFNRRNELEMFKMLISVSGVGPKAGLNVLSCISLNDLRFGILSEDTALLSKVPGIGKKTAAKIILELKDKIDMESSLEEEILTKNESASSTVELKGIRNEASMALEALGYSRTDARKAVSEVEQTDNMTVEYVLKAALKYIR